MYVPYVKHASNVGRQSEPVQVAMVHLMTMTMTMASFINQNIHTGHAIESNKIQSF